jgi:AcrR family transcriptional regulator
MNVSRPTAERTTVLDRALEPDVAQRPTPLDALRVAREQWLTGERLDMGGLAVDLGVSRATLYRWVGTKERLLGEVVWSLAQVSFDEARAAASGAGAEYVVEVIRRYLTAALQFEPLRRFIEQDPEYALKVLASRHSAMQRRSIVATRSMLDEQIAAGALEPALDVDVLAYLIVRIAESFLYSDVITGTEPDIPTAAQAINALLHAPRL